MSISTEESISILIEIYKECCPDEIVNFKQEIANGNGEWLIDSCLNDYKIKSQDINLKLYQSGRIVWLLSYLLNYHHTVLIDYFLSKIDKEKNRKGVNATYSLENLFSVLLKSGNLRIDELEKLLDKKTREDFIYDSRGSTKYLRYAIERIKKELDQSSEISKFQTIFNEIELKEIYSRSKKARIITCSRDDFMYWFGGIGQRGSKIKWLLKWKKGNPHKSALYWYCEKLNPNAKPSEMSKIFNVKVDSNNKGYCPTDKMKNIFNL
jgi:hypothetical protein